MAVNAAQLVARTQTAEVAYALAMQNAIQLLTPHNVSVKLRRQLISRSTSWTNGVESTVQIHGTDILTMHELTLVGRGEAWSHLIMFIHTMSKYLHHDTENNRLLLLRPKSTPNGELIAIRMAHNIATYREHYKALHSRSMDCW